MSYRNKIKKHTERQGFEPWSRFKAGNAFRVRPIQPL